MSKLNNSQIPDTLSSKTIDNTNSIDTTTTNLSISGGSSGQVLSTDGSGNLSWATAGGGGGSYPTSETISSGAIDTSKTISYITGNVTLDSAPKGTIKYIVNDEESSNELLTKIISGGSVNSLIQESSTENIIFFGDFTSYNSTSNTNKIAKYTPSTDTTTSIGGGVTTGTTIHRAKYDSLGRLWIVGNFTNVGGVTCSNIAYFDGTNWNAGNVGTINGDVRQIIFDSSNIGNYWICGQFTTANGVTVNRFSYFNGTTYVAYGTGLNSGITHEMYQDAITSHIYIVGEFTSANGVTHTSKITRFDISLGTFNAVGTTNFLNNGIAYCVYANNNQVYIGGNQLTMVTPLFTGVSSVSFIYYNGISWNLPTNRVPSQVRNIRYINGEIYVLTSSNGIVFGYDYSEYQAYQTEIRGIVKYNTTTNKFMPYTYANTQQPFDIIENTLNNKLYIASGSGLSDITPLNLVTVSTTGTTKMICQNSLYSPITSTNILGILMAIKGATIQLVSNGTDWYLTNTPNTNTATNGYLLSMEKFI
jgi:hypothetical protein